MAEISAACERLVDATGRINRLLFSLREPLDVELLNSLNPILAAAASKPEAREPQEVEGDQGEGASLNHEKNKEKLTSSWWLMPQQFSLFLLSLIVVIFASVFFYNSFANCPEGMNHFLPMRGYCYGYHTLNGTMVDMAVAKEKCKVRKAPPWIDS